MMLKIFIFTLISLLIILYFVNRYNQETFQGSTTKASDNEKSTTSASSDDASTTSASSDDASTTPASTSNASDDYQDDGSRVSDITDQVSSTTGVSGQQTTSVVELDEYNTNTLIGNSIDQSIDMGTNYNNYFQGGFCKYQEKLGYKVGCSGHIYDNAFFNIDRELNSVKDNYSILKS